MMARSLICLVIVVFSASAANDDSRTRKLLGKWVAADNAGAAWIFEEAGDKLKITHTRGAERHSEFECNTSGQECEAKEEDKTAKASMYFLGPKLVQIVMKNPEVEKRRFTVSEDGDALEVEVMPVVPPGKAQTKTYRRVAEPAQAR